MTRYIAKSQEGTVEFLLLPNRDGSGWKYVNLTDGHICPCKFASKEEAVKEFAKGAGGRQDCGLHADWRRGGKAMTEEELKWEELEERIKELEKEKCELLGLIQGKDRDDYLAGAEPREKRIAELEKENAELKGQVEMSNKVYNDNLDYSHHIEESLTKAKELIRMVVDSYNHKERFSFEKDLMKAEAFLKEE